MHLPSVVNYLPDHIVFVPKLSNDIRFFFGHAGLFFSALMCCNAEKSLLPIHGKERWKLYRSIHMYRLFLAAVYKAERREIRFFPWPSTPISAPFSRVIPARQGRKVDLFSSYAEKKQLLPNYFFDKNDGLGLQVKPQ